MKRSLRLNVASRLNLAFAVLSLGFVAIVVVGAVSLERINRGVTQVVEGAVPAQKAVADLQIELLEVSRLAIEHYNSVESGQLSGFEAEYQRARTEFEQSAQELDTRLKQLGGLDESREQMAAIVDRSQALFANIQDNMRIYGDSLIAQQDIERLRAELRELQQEVDPLFNEFLSDTVDPKVKALVFDVRSISVQGFALANELSLINNVAEFHKAKDRFLDVMDEYSKLGFKMLGLARNNETFAGYQQQVGTLVGTLMEKVTANEGLFPLQNNMLQIKASLRIRVTNTQAGLNQQVEALGSIATKVNQAATGIGAQATGQVSQSRLTLIAVAVAAVAFCVVLSFLVVRSIRQPLKRLHSYMTQVGKGDFTVQFGRHTQDELGDISKATEQLVHALRQMISRILDHNQTLNRVALETAEISDSTSSHVERQRSELDMVVTAINEMTSSIREVAGNAEVASKDMHESEKDAKAIEGTVAATMDAVTTLEENMSNAVTVIKQLDEGVTSIEDILETIQSIAEQTNLLALNAAIEAARAGEQGRGFAVVADEVRTLAGRTQKSTEEIRDKIEWMLKQSASAVSVIETSQQSTHAVSDQTRTAQERFTRFLEAITRLNELNSMIATASEEQSATTEEINKNIVAIREVSEDTAVGAQKASQQTHQLQDVAKDLNEAVSQFKV